MASTPTWAFDLRPQTRLVLGHGLVDVERPASGVTEPLDDGSWASFSSELSIHRLTGLAIATVAADEIPTTSTQRAEIARLEVELTRARMWQEQRFNEVMAQLADARIDAWVLKGRATAALDYPDEQLRPTSDLDLLIRGDDVDRTRELFGSLGAQQRDLDPTPGYGATIGKGGGVTLPDGLEVDLHRTLVAGAFGVRIRVEDLWDQGRAFELGGEQHMTLSIEASLLHHCYHLLIFGYPRALTLRDVAQLALAPDLDVDRVLWLARRWRGEVVLAAALRMARREIALAPSNALFDWGEGYSPTLRERAWLRIEQSGEHLSPFMAVGEYLALPTAGERAIFRRATLHPAPGSWQRLDTRMIRMTRRLARTAVDRVANRA
jgi:hypothetical protein